MAPPPAEGLAENGTNGLHGGLAAAANGPTSTATTNASSDLLFYLNGKRVVLEGAKPEMTLLQYLRSTGLTGTKLGCGEGGCGACTVMVSTWDRETGKPQHLAVNACLAPLCSVDGCAVTTVEGIGSIRAGLHPIQRRIAELHGSQCGFCTPGIVMAMYALFRQYPDATPHFIEENMDGNLCRCTGYRPIIDAAKTLAGGCCRGKNGGGCPCKEDPVGDLDVHETTESRLSDSRFPSLADSTTEPIFPPELALSKPRAVTIVSSASHWHRPTSLPALLAVKHARPHARLVAGNTEVGIETKFKAVKVPVIISPTAVPELTFIKVTDTGLEVGAAVTLARLQHFIERGEAGLGAPPHDHRTASLHAIVHMLRWFASNQIRNVASVAGNIATASPISDLNPVLVAAGATLRLASQAGLTEHEGVCVRMVSARDFFLGYRKVDMRPTEVIQSVVIPFTHRFEFVAPFKQARRREDDISIVTACVRVRLAPAEAGWLIEDAGLGFGGMAPTTVAAKQTESVLKGKPWNEETVEAAYDALAKDMPLPSDVPGGQAEFRRALPPSFLFKFYVATCQELAKLVGSSDSVSLPPPPSISPEDESAAETFVTADKPSTRGEQRFTLVSSGGGMTNARPAPFTPAPEDEAAKGRGAVGKPIPHKSAMAQVTGEARYVDDMPPPHGLLHGVLVMSTKPHAKLVSVDPTPALAIPGVVRFISYKDIPLNGTNKIGAVVKDEECFATEKVTHVGAVIGLIVAESEPTAQEGARAVVITYDELPAHVSLQSAVEKGEFFEAYGKHVLKDGGNVEEALETPGAVVVEGEMRMGGQEHFYLEPNVSMAVPGEDGDMEVFSSTQNPTKTQNFCAYVCGLPANKVVCRMKRMGGGFGGKETRSVFIACTVALAAHVLQRPVKITLDRDVDMQITGQRHAFVAKYRAAASPDGKLLGLDVSLVNNGGFSLDLSGPVADRALFHIDNCYHWPTMRAQARIARTNQASHTAFRGFGGPQGMVITEAVMDHLASALGMDPELFREVNLYAEGQRTHFGQQLVRWNVPRAWEDCKKAAEVEARRAAVRAFNAANRYRKRGLCAVPTKFGINFTAKFMNQGGALVHVYQDGTVLVSHGGTEMGQGLHTKVIQIAARAFGISETQVHISETATDRVANSNPTAASMSTDLYGMATLDACEKIMERLKPVIARMPNASFKDIAQAAFFQRIDLTAHGYYAVADDRCGYDWDMVTDDNSKRGHPFNYFTQGVACSEVEIDCLTGDARVVRADIVMDVGNSINPALDIGQIEGAFVQGVGWMTTEELIWGDEDHKWVRPGQLFTRGPGAYKIPAFNDVPIDMRVTLMRDVDNPVCVHSSKAIGEPPFFLSASAFFAIKDAVRAYREQNGVSGHFEFYSPASSERIRMACADRFSTRAADGSDIASYQPKASY